MKTLYFDCATGISGNMAIGALLEVCDGEQYLRGELAKLGVLGYDVKIIKKDSHGIDGTYVEVVEAGTDNPVDTLPEEISGRRLYVHGGVQYEHGEAYHHGHENHGDYEDEDSKSKKKSKEEKKLAKKLKKKKKRNYVVSARSRILRDTASVEASMLTAQWSYGKITMNMIMSTITTMIMNIITSMDSIITSIIIIITAITTSIATSPITIMVIITTERMVI